MRLSKTSDYIEIDENEDVEILFLSDEEWQSSLSNKSALASVKDEVAFAVMSEEIKYSRIFVNIDKVYGVDYEVVIAHEYSHILFHEVDEEKTDRNCFQFLVESEIGWLKSQWEIRHGHKFEEI